MKCPNCGHWNQPSFPRCFKCGTPLESPAEKTPAWRDQFAKPHKDKVRILYDDADVQPTVEEFAAAGQKPESAPQSLSAEMAHLHERRARGEKYLESYRTAAENSTREKERASGVRIRHSAETTPVALESETASSRSARDSVFADDRSIEETRYTATMEDFVELDGSEDDLDDYDDPYNDLYDDSLPPTGPAVVRSHHKKRRRLHRPFLIAVWVARILLVLAIGAVGLLCWTFVDNYIDSNQAPSETVDALIETREIDGLPGHRITILAAEGTQCYISELTKSYVAVNGTITIDVADHVFYDHIEHLEADSMTVELTPTMIYMGKEERKAPITYEISIPATTLMLISPETVWAQVTTSVYNIRLQVDPGSEVIINNTDVTDTVNEDGVVDYNPVVQAIGDNIVSIIARAPYCRESRLTVTLYREPMSIPIELDAAVLSETSDAVMTINATTRVGATISMDTPYESIDTEKLNTTGEFTVKAKMTRVGYNDITIRASYPGEEDSTLTHTVYYLPTADKYTTKAWALTSSDYSELMNNIKMRVENAQIYECKGTITQIISETPQIAIMDTGVNGKEQLVMLQNSTQTTWQLGESYRIFADVSGVYGSMPKLTARYTYSFSR